MTTTCNELQRLRNRLRVAPFGTNERAQALARLRQYENTHKKRKGGKK